MVNWDNEELKEKKQTIRLYFIDGNELRKKKDFSEYRYKVLGLIDFHPIGGQGDVGFDWAYLCENKDGKPVIISEQYDISWYASPSVGSISLDNLFSLEEERLSQEEYEIYHAKMMMSLNEEVVTLPISLNLENVPTNSQSE